MDTSIQEAFDRVLSDATAAETWYVALVEDRPYYGGPEEGGWWGHDTDIVAYKEFASEALARAAADAVEALAVELERDARAAHGRHCLDELDWLDARGLDADFLPEPDGPPIFRVVVTSKVPCATRGPRHYA